MGGGGAGRVLEAPDAVERRGAVGADVARLVDLVAQLVVGTEGLGAASQEETASSDSAGIADEAALKILSKLLIYIVSTQTLLKS